MGWFANIIFVEVTIIKKAKSKFKIIDKRSVFIGKDVVVGNNVTIYENNRIEGKTVIKDGAVILPNCYIIDSEIGENAVINYSQSDKAIVGNNCTVGPFARLRPNAVIGDGAKIGNFVEIKNAKIGKGSKVSHLAYVGDADVGENCNIGCGAIFVNYDGVNKHRTTVGNGSFIGSNCNIIAPVNIGDGAYVCAGTTVSSNVNNNDFVIGRVRQEVKENRADRYLKKGEK